MGLKAQMHVETPAGGRDRSKDCTGEREDVPPEAAWQTHTQGGCALSTRDIGLGRPMTSPRTFMMSSSTCGGFGRQLWHAWHVWQVPEA
jgi:hypothetical protein